jgi:hypothetical protein
MSIQAKIHVIYLDSYQVSIKCDDQSMYIKTVDVLLRLPEDGGVLIVLGRYSHFCPNAEYGMIFSKKWHFEGNDIQFEIGDPEKEGIYGNFTITLNRIHHIVYYI